MATNESESKSASGSGSETKNNSTAKEEKNNNYMKKLAFYNPELISKRKVIINTSTSKEMYSFPTTKRFTDFVRDESPFFYNIPTTITKRSTSFGFGSKNAFPDNNKTPGPGTYKHLLQINNKGRYAISELPNSQQNKFGNEIRFKFDTINTETPGPNAYNLESMIKGNGIIYNSRYKTKLGKSMGQRLIKIGEKLITPGPGSYKYMNMNKYGKYPSSILSNSIQNKFGNETRFKYTKDNGNPAPNAYQPESMIKGNGIIYNSRYNTNLGKSMGCKLNELSKSVTPGPGAYEFFSDFEGFYKYGKKKKNSDDENENDDDENNEEENGSGNNSGEGSKSGNSQSEKKKKNKDDKKNESNNGKNLVEIFGKDVKEEIKKVRIKKPKLE